MAHDELIDYSARTAYEPEEVAANYERVRFSGPLGRYRWSREQNAVREAIDHVPPGSTILDCPCGIGRWLPLLAGRAKKIIAADISESMLSAAGARSGALNVEVSTMKANAEAIPLPDNSVDWVFSHALTKHLPFPVQHRVLKEFGRVARAGVICSFGVFTPLNYAVWRARKLEESHPVLPEQLAWLASEAGLRVVWSRSCTTPLGVERTLVFKHAARS